MNREEAKQIIINTFEKPFNKENYIKFLKNLLKFFDEKNTFSYVGQFIPDAYKDKISSFERIGKYTYDDKEIDLLIVNIKKESKLERARTSQRNFISWYLKGSRGGKLKDAALVAFVSPESDDWRFSLVKMEYKFEQTSAGKINVKEDFTPAKRWSFLVGENESSHTAQSRFLPILEYDDFKPTLDDLENAFNVEIVTKEFFEKYRDLFIKTKQQLDKIVKKDEKIKKEFTIKKINTVDFAKKLLGQITFLYFLQKKGWFGVEKGKNWGTGPKDFIRQLFNKKYGKYTNFFNDILEPLFYEALRTDRSPADHFYSRFNCKIPFLNGGLFDPINNYDWVNTEILLSNDLFSNENKTKEGDIGDGILDIFDRYNFTVNEEEPLEKEVALDPELLGKIYEKLNAIRQDNFDEYLKVISSGNKGEENKFNKEYGVYYTPREIVHYMCQESIINFLATELNSKVRQDDLEEFVLYADLIYEHEKTALQKSEAINRGEIKGTKYEHKIPQSIREHSKEIDKLLANIKICDPAIGSGAFPIGMLQEIVKLRRLLSIYCNTGIPACKFENSHADEVHITHRNLPHWTKKGSIYWVTFRLADSLPQEKLEIWKSERDEWLKKHPQPWNDEEWQEFNKNFLGRLENWLDSGYGSCVLSIPEIREKVKECIMKYDGVRLKIHAVVIMPNHVHLLIEPLMKYSLSEILKGIKGASANEVNKILGTTGKKVWMEESYDHIVRSEKEYFHFINYIKENPTKAHLTVDNYWLYVAQVFLLVDNKDTQTGMSVLHSADTQTRMSVLLPPDSQTGMSVLHSSYDLKRHCIENSLYGVDIDSGAVEVCKLRFWLSMIVDEEDFKTIKPLPNLDYKVVCGDSLLGVEKDLFNNQAFEKLEKLKPQYFNETNPNNKQKLKKEIDKIIDEITNGHNEFDFEVYFSEVFHQKGGFDVVIANPPYVQLQKSSGRFANLYQNKGFSVFDRMGDIYCLFYEKGIKILKEGGHLCFITSNKWMRAGYGEKLRNFFLQYNPKVLVDLGPGVFESATVDTNIILIQKVQKQLLSVRAVTLAKDEDINIANQLTQLGVILEKLSKDAWFIGSDAEQRLKEKIERIGKPLKDWDVKIYRGILTGLNEAFIISTEKRNEILANCKTEDERRRTEAIIKPILRGRDIKRYYYEWAGLWVIVIPAGWTNENKKNEDPEIFIKKNFPSLMNYLIPFEDKAKKRDDQGDYWWELRACAYYPEFEKEKVVWQRITQEPTFCLVKSGVLILDSMAFFTGKKLKFIMALLNSRLIYQYVNMIVHQYGFTGYRLSNQYVEIIPLPPITEENQHIVNQIESLVDKILASKKQNLQADTTKLEEEIDQLVYQLYDLTEDEIKIIEKDNKKECNL